MGWEYEAINYDIASDEAMYAREADRWDCAAQGESAIGGTGRAHRAVAAPLSRPRGHQFAAPRDVVGAIGQRREIDAPDPQFQRAGACAVRPAERRADVVQRPGFAAHVVDRDDGRARVHRRRRRQQQAPQPPLAGGRRARHARSIVPADDSAT